MAELVDIHTHLLPGVDDGPEDLPGSLDMARIAVSAGITTIAATPHLRSDFPGVHLDEIAHRCRQLQDAFHQEGLDLTVISGAETSLVWALEASDEELLLASYGQRGDDLLIETPTDVSMIENLLFALRTRGYRVTLAHPERSPEFQRTPEAIHRLHEQGILLQVNARAVMQSRTPVGRLAGHLLREGLAHAVASDGHRAADWRPLTDLPAALGPLSELIGSARARWMTSEAPAAILAGEELPPEPPARTPVRRGWLRGRLIRS